MNILEVENELVDAHHDPHPEGSTRWRSVAIAALGCANDILRANGSDLVISVASDGTIHCSPLERSESADLETTPGGSDAATPAPSGRV